MLKRDGKLGSGEITITNGFPDDALVTFSNALAGAEPFLVVYVRSLERVILLDIPEGTYTLDITVGQGWNGETFPKRTMTFRLKQSLTFESMPIVIRSAAGTRVARVPSEGWSVVLSAPSPETPAASRPAATRGRSR